MAEKLDLDFFENVIAYHLLTDELYLASVCDDLSPTYFKDKNVQTIVGIITEFYKTRNTVPSTTEIKSYLTTADLKNAFVNLVQSFNNLDKNFVIYTNCNNFSLLKIKLPNSFNFYMNVIPYFKIFFNYTEYQPKTYQWH